MTYFEKLDRFYIATMGCQMNEYDSDFISDILSENGCLPVDSPDAADLIIINTCSVREKAEQKAFSMLGRMIVLKKMRPEIVLGFTGCIAQQEGLSLLKKYHELDFVIGTRELVKIKDILKKPIFLNGMLKDFMAL